MCDNTNDDYMKDWGSGLRFCDFSSIYLFNEIFGIGEFSIGL